MSTTAVVLIISVLILQISSISSQNTFSIAKYGAKYGGKIDNKKAFLDAWAAACKKPGTNKVVVPGGTYGLGAVIFSGPCKGNVVFEVVGTIMAPDDLSQFPGMNWIVFQHVKGLKVTGKGTFDGRGGSAWSHNQCRKTSRCKALPTSIQFSYVDNSIVEGITSLNSKMFHIMIFQCNHIHFNYVNIKAPANSPNTDGIHIALSTNVEIRHANIATGDDCISVGPTNSFVTITDVNCGPGHGIGVGSLGKYSFEKDVTNLYVKDSTLSNTMNGLRIKTWKKSTQLTCRNFTFDNIIMENVANPIIIDQEYSPSAGCNSMPPSNVKIEDIKYLGVRGSSSTPVALNLKCSKKYPCENIVLKDINLEYTKGKAEATVVNVQGLTTKGGVISPSVETK